MRSILLGIFIIVVLQATSCKRTNEPHAHDHAVTAPEAADTSKKSIPKTEHAQIGGAHLMITYHAPAVRGRTIWGGLVPYGEVWVTGAHSATTFESDKTVDINGTEIPAGKYAIFTIPGKEKWVVIVNKNWDQHLADEYDAKDDVARLEVVPERLPAPQERLKYAITPGSVGSATISIVGRTQA